MTEPGQSDMIGRSYRLRGERVVVRARWAPPADVGSAACPHCGTIYEAPRGCRAVYCGCERGIHLNDDEPIRVRRQGPHNVLIEHMSIPEAAGNLSVRPFRGLRRWR